MEIVRKFRAHIFFLLKVKQLMISCRYGLYDRTISRRLRSKIDSSCRTWRKYRIDVHPTITNLGARRNPRNGLSKDQQLCFRGATQEGSILGVRCLPSSAVNLTVISTLV